MFNKAIVALITPIVFGILLPFGITEATPTGETLNIIFTALGTMLMVYWVPNKK